MIFRFEKKAVFFVLFFLLFGSFSLFSQKKSNNQGLRVSSTHPQYFAYGGKEVLLLGGSAEDNLFQMPGVEKHLDKLRQTGGNYVRCTMSSRDSGNVWAFAFEAEKQSYNLRRWNEEYWQRFARFLKYTHNHQIFVQIEIWATFDFYRQPWNNNPFNPKNNSNYTPQRVKLPTQIETHPTHCDNPFFWSIPSQHNNMALLTYQQAFVDKILSYTLKYDHVLYCMDNETSVTSEWGKFWSVYIQKRAAEAGKKVLTTEMWDPWDLNHLSHRESFDHPEVYSFVEISQNNHQRGQRHWDRGLAQISRLAKAGNLRPVTNIKIYGSNSGKHGGNDQDAVEKFVRAVLFGSASARFHRPASGLGLSPKAQKAIKSVRMISESMDFFNARPYQQALSACTENEAFCRAIPGKEYVVYFPQSGEVQLDLIAYRGKFLVRPLDLPTAGWGKSFSVEGGEKINLQSNSPNTIFLILKAL